MIVPSPAPVMSVLLAFNASNQLAVRRAGTKLGHAFAGADEAMALARLEANFPIHTPPAEYFSCTVNSVGYRIFSPRSPVNRPILRSVSIPSTSSPPSATRWRLPSPRCWTSLNPT